MPRFTVLMVCTGNTCRSPMAQALARRMMAARKEVDEADLAQAGAEVLSAGVGATPGDPATPEAVQALAALGIDLSRHRSRELSRQLIQQSDVIYAMTEAHRAAVVELDPEAASRVIRLDPAGDIADPIGADIQAYARTAAQIRQALEQRLNPPPASPEKRGESPRR